MDQTQLQALIAPDFRGVVSVTRGDEVLFEAATGYADLANQWPNAMNTRFGTASAGKAFVACGILQQVAAGKLQLGDALAKHWAHPAGQLDLSVTLGQLLCHTSGIPDYFDEETMDDYAELFVDFPNYRVRTNADLLPLFIDKPMADMPGQRFRYNNAGYVVLALVLEQATGQPFDVTLQQAVFAPAGMADTGYYELDRLPARCANAYIYDETREEYYTNIYSIDAKGTGAGGAFTTAGDVGRFWAALNSGLLLPKDLAAQMKTPQAPGGEYGFGLWLQAQENRPAVPNFQGFDPGVSFVSSCDEAGVVVTQISNFGDRVWATHWALRQALY